MKYDYYFRRLEAFYARYKKPTKWVLGVLVVFAMLSYFANLQSSRPKTFKDRVEQHLSKWDGSHKQLEAYIKASMNDPGSYQHISTKYIMPADSSFNSAVFITTFRGKNAFGGVVTQTVRARCNIKTGKVEAIISE